MFVSGGGVCVQAPAMPGLQSATEADFAGRWTPHTAEPQTRLGGLVEQLEAVAGHCDGEEAGVVEQLVLELGPWGSSQGWSAKVRTAKLPGTVTQTRQPAQRALQSSKGSEQ